MASGTYKITINKAGYKDEEKTIMVGNTKVEIEVNLTSTGEPVITDGWSPGTGWKLEWSDEFNKPEIDASNWSFQECPAGQYNNELQKYVKSADNCYIESKAGTNDGMMVIKAIKTGAGLNKGDFTSARMISYSKQNFMYGKIAARIKVPYGQGIWPAFWMLGSNCSENPDSIS